MGTYHWMGERLLYICRNEVRSQINAGRNTLELVDRVIAGTIGGCQQSSASMLLSGAEEIEVVSVLPLLWLRKSKVPALPHCCVGATIAATVCRDALFSLVLASNQSAPPQG